MTIKDIAKAAGVSVATVSKILNHKDENITEETRQKVLAVVEENQFVPYAKLRSKLSVPQDKIGILIPELSTPFHSAFMEQLTERLNQSGYAPLTYITNYQPEKELAGMEYFKEQKVPLTLIFPSGYHTMKTAEKLFHDSSELLFMNYKFSASNTSQCYCDYEPGILQAMDHLLQKGCQRIGMLLQRGNDYIEDVLKKGFQLSLSAVMRDYDQSLVIYNDERVQEDINILIDAGVDALVCQDIQCARQVYQAAAERFLLIPQDLSVIALEAAAGSTGFSPALTTITYDPEKLAEQACSYAENILNPKKKNPEAGNIPVLGKLNEQNSIRTPALESERILVIGHLNMDIMMKIPHSPKVGKRLSASQLNTLPGGKGGNQAVAISKLGGNSCMIGALGNDLYGKQLYESLMRAGVNTDGITFHNNVPTGTAYVSLLPDGNSLIIGNNGANELLDINYLGKHEKLFEDARFCVLQMEMDVETISYILDICRRKKITTVLKPNVYNPLPEQLYDKIDILVPNQSELDSMQPGSEPVVERAKALQQKGFSDVIVTLGENGCLWTCATSTAAFAAEQQRCVDATGASDIFISYLVFLLAENYSMKAAVKMANYAAGLSIMWEGVQSAVPELRMVEHYFND